jgi:hypothetical protein
VIGVYEPLVVGDENGVRTTSRAAEPELRVSAAACYHRDCHAMESEAMRAPARQEVSGR